MAKTRVKTWATDDILTAADLNAEFDNFLTNPMDLISPAVATLDLNAQTLILDADADTNIAASSDDQIDITLGGSLIYTILAASWDFNGKQLILDADGDSSLTVDTDDVAHLELQGMDAFIFDGNVASPVNGLTFTSSATGVAVGIDAHGTDDNIGITFTPKGTGVILAGSTFDMNGLELILDTDADTSITADSDDIVHLKVQGFDAFIFDGDVGTPVNGLTFFSAATTGAAAIGAHGSDTNINIQLIPKGAGGVLFGGSELFLDVDADSSITVDTDDVLHMKLQGVDAFIFDGDVGSPVNGLTFTSSATGNATSITAHGSDTNINLNLIAKGSGVLQTSGNAVHHVGEDFESTSQTMTAATLLTVAHGLGARPDQVWAVLRCITGELGYATGDEYAINGIHSASATITVLGLAADATNIYVAQNSGSVFIIQKSATVGTVSAITRANWGIVVRARLT